jgi:hypothetical protein
MLYNAMFDEVDEGTAILKGCTKKSLAPSDGYWLTFDADGYNNLPSDWYLRLAGLANKMLNKQIPLTKAMPLNPNKPDSGVAVVEKPRHVAVQGKIDIRNGILYLPALSQEKNVVVITRLSGEAVGKIELENSGGMIRLPLRAVGVISSGVYLMRINSGKRTIAGKCIIDRVP